jgi:tetratricopeptide (TPR) repeat protein
MDGREPVLPQAPAPAIHRLGDFDLIREVGRGGMGIVYEARQRSLNRRVALKVLPPGLGLSELAVQRFEREARAAAQLHHPNIVPVHAIGEDEGCHFYAMDLVEGVALSRILSDMRQHAPTPLAEGEVLSSSGREWFDTVARLVAEAADALHYAHGQGVVHRDIKPANLMLSRERRLCITDFGLARVAQEPGMTLSGSLMGTPAYMSPEQIAAGRMPLDHRTDVYSLGAVLYEMLTLQRPFPGDSREEIVAGILTRDPPPPRRLNPRIPVDLETICQRAMEKDPERRYASAGDFAADLGRYLRGELIAARRAGLLRRAAKLARGHPVATTIGLAAVLSVAVIAGITGILSSQKALATARLAVSEARRQLERGEYRAGLDRARQALELAPGLADARLVRARIQLQRIAFREAADDARAVLGQDPENWEAHLVLAVAAKKGELAGISPAEHVAAVEDKVPDTADAHYLRALLAGSAHEAISWLDRALEREPDHAPALLERSARYGQLMNFRGALADAERLVAVRSKSAQGRRQIGWIHWQLKDEERALEEYRKAIELDPEDPLNYRQRAFVYVDRGRIDEALADFTRAIDLDPDNSDLLKNRAILYNLKGQYEQAAADAERAIARNPDERWAYGELFSARWNSGQREAARSALGELKQAAERWVDPRARAYVHELASRYHRLSGEREQAALEADQVIALLPNDLRAYRLRAQIRREVLGEKGIAEDCTRMAALELAEPQEFLSRARTMHEFCHRIDQALADYSTAIQLAPTWAAPYQQRSYLFRIEGDLDHSLADIKTAVEQAPKWLQARSDLADRLADQERFQEALNEIQKIFDLGGEGDDLRWQKAQVLLRLGRDSEALAVLDEWIAREPRRELPLRRRAEALFRLGRIEEALSAVDRAVEAEPATPRPYLYRARYGQFLRDRCAAVRSDLTKAAELDPASAEICQARAFVVAAHAPHMCPELYDPTPVLELARRAVDYEPRIPGHEATLGIALYRAGRLEQARDALERATTLRIDNNPIDTLFLAMATARLGDLRRARSHYDRAVARIEGTYPRNPEYQRFREEAARLLGLGP